MKLNPECIRDTLIFCENFDYLSAELIWNPISLRTFCEALPKYSRKDIAYTLYLLCEADYIEAHIVDADNGIAEILVYRLTYTGHEFIDTIQSDTVWKKLKKALTSAGSLSLPVIQSLGSHYALEYLKNL